jgi:hypothetical protein
MWEYEGYPGYQASMELYHRDPNAKTFQKQLLPMLRHRHNQICLEFAYWATSPPADHNALYELRSYTLQPGHLLEWESHWKKGLEIRRQYCTPVGAWFTQLGELSQVHHMWTYPDLETRKRNREAAWSASGWAETVYNTGKFQ